MAHRIILRAEWGAIHPNGAGPAPIPADEVWLHHSVTIAPDLVPPFTDDYAAVRTLERIGQDRFGAGISYTFPITPAGLIFEGHSIDRRGAHTAGHNTHGRAICFVGNYEAIHPTDAQLDAAGWLLAHGFFSGWWDAAELQGGHRDVKGTACPGQHAYDAMPRIDAIASAYARGAVATPTEDALSAEDVKQINAKIDSEGHEVRKWVGEELKRSNQVMTAEIRARTAALGEAVGQLGAGGTIDYGRVEQAAEKAVRDVLGSLDG